MTIWWSGWALAAAAVVFAGACGGSENQYVKDSNAGSYLRVPGDWKVYDEDNYLRARSLNLTESQIESRKPQVSVWVLDGAEEPDIEHAFDPLADEPVGTLNIIDASPAVADQLSPSFVRNLQYEIDSGVSQGGWDVHSIEPLESDGFRGERVVVDIPAGAAIDGAPTNVFLTWDQTFYISDDASRFYVLAIGCEAHCYDTHKAEIDKIVDSWTVRKR